MSDSDLRMFTNDELLKAIGQVIFGSIQNYAQEKKISIAQAETIYKEEFKNFEKFDLFSFTNIKKDNIDLTLDGFGKALAFAKKDYTSDCSLKHLHRLTKTYCIIVANQSQYLDIWRFTFSPASICSITESYEQLLAETISTKESAYFLSKPDFKPFILEKAGPKILKSQTVDFNLSNDLSLNHQIGVEAAERSVFLPPQNFDLLVFGAKQEVEFLQMSIKQTKMTKDYDYCSEETIHFVCIPKSSLLPYLNSK